MIAFDESFLPYGSHLVALSPLLYDGFEPVAWGKVSARGYLPGFLNTGISLLVTFACMDDEFFVQMGPDFGRFLFRDSRLHSEGEALTNDQRFFKARFEAMWGLL